MPLKMTQRREEEVPHPTSAGRANEELEAVQAELSKLAPGMVLEIETDAESSVRRTKGLVTRASKQLGRPVRHWHEGTKVYAKPADAPRRRGRPPKSAE